MHLICVDDGGFEDQITNGHSYYAIETGVNGYLIEADNGKEVWLGEMHFAIVNPADPNVE